MATVHLLGTGAALSDPERTTTMLAVEGGSSLHLVDCGGDAAQRLLASGIELPTVSDLIVTHEHADHVSGFPLLMERLWLAGIGASFAVRGIRPALDQARKIHDAFDIGSWPNYPRLDYREFALEDGALVLEDDDFVVRAAPGRHSVPVVGLRFDSKRTGRSVAYSCDTEYSPSIVRLAEGADLLLHEATGEGPGHSTSASAGRVAKEAGVGRLVLVHLPPLNGRAAEWLEAARASFPDTVMGSDGDRIEF
ncbi:MAG TPA: MBL fold metallo-hydrolase [Trueperaceae bacterium]